MLSKKAVLAASLILLGCSSDKTTGAGSLTGTLTFTYTGGVSGTYNASGALNSLNFETQAWAAAAVDASDISVASAVPRNSTSHDFVVIFVDGTTTGARSAAINCSSTCAELSVIFGNANGSGSTFLFACDLEAGTVTITEITATRVKGTFSGTGTCFPPAGTPTTAFTVTNGTFDVPRVSSVP